MSQSSSNIDGNTAKAASKEAKTMLVPPGTGRSKESAPSVASEKKGKVTPKSQQSESKLRTSLWSSPKPPTKQPPQNQTIKQTSSDAAQARRCGASVKMPDRGTSSRSDKTLSSIVKVKHKKDNGLPVAWRKELYGPRPGSAQARLENLRAALQKQIEEQKAKPAPKIPIKPSKDGKSPPIGAVTPSPSTSKSSSASVSTVATTSAVPKVKIPKHTDAVAEATKVKQANTAPLATVKEKHENTCEMDVDGVESNSPERAECVPPAVQNVSNFGQYKIPIKIPDRSSSGRSDKMLSSIVKVKHKKENGLPVAWRKELYGTRPGSAQSRLESLRATLQKEAEEQNITKPASSIPHIRSVDHNSLPKKQVIPSASINQPSSMSVTTVPAVPEVPALKHTVALPEVSAVQQHCTAPDAANRAEYLDDSCEMEVDEPNSPEPAKTFPPAVQWESNMQEGNTYHSTTLSDEVKSKEETRDDSHKVEPELKTKYTDGLSAFANYFYCVIDTNIFIENYNDFQGFLSKKYSGSQPIVIVPYKVLHELDTVKHKKPQLASKITTVVKFLHQMLRRKDARVKGQHPWDDTIELMPVLSPDDSIINCALQVQSVAASENVKVLLVSNDCNMLTKAIVANLSTCTMEELQADYKF